MPVALSLAVTLFTAPLPGQAVAATLKQRVFAAESSFAASFARRDTAGFAALVASDAVFFGQNSVMRGKAAVIDGWRGLFREPAPPFSWKPEVIEVAESGNLAFSSGPVYDAEGRQFGNFNSIWRREPDGTWRVVFDKGCPVCNCGP
ncbi:MAG: YybH family protein, partial [Gammaproteobacteria bacterium]